LQIAKEKIDIAKRIFASLRERYKSLEEENE